MAVSHAGWQAAPAGDGAGCSTGAAGFTPLGVCQPVGFADCSYTVVTLLGLSETGAAGPHRLTDWMTDCLYFTGLLLHLPAGPSHPFSYSLLLLLFFSPPHLLPFTLASHVTREGHVKWRGRLMQVCVCSLCVCSYPSENQPDFRPSKWGHLATKTTLEGLNLKVRCNGVISDNSSKQPHWKSLGLKLDQDYIWATEGLNSG